jgi:hypothetical protein
MVLRDMQRAAIDSVKHASKIGMKLNEDAVGQFQVRIAIKEQVESALYQFTEFRNEQARTLTALTDGLRDLMRTIDRRNGEVINLISNQPLGSSDLRDAVNQLPQSLEAAHSSLQAQAEFSRSLVDELRALREAGRR